MQVTPGSMDALCSLLHTPFFHPCPTCSTGGSAQRDTTVNHFNLDSLVAGCSHCLPAHGSGQRVLQVSLQCTRRIAGLAGRAVQALLLSYVSFVQTRLCTLGVPRLNVAVPGCRSGGPATTVRAQAAQALPVLCQALVILNPWPPRARLSLHWGGSGQCLWLFAVYGGSFVCTWCRSRS